MRILVAHKDFREINALRQEIAKLKRRLTPFLSFLDRVLINISAYYRQTFLDNFYQ